MTTAAVDLSSEGGSPLLRGGGKVWELDCLKVALYNDITNENTTLVCN